MITGKSFRKGLDQIEARLSRILNLLHQKGLREKPLIFIGTSLSREDASQIIDAEIWPPIARGDLPRAIQKGFRWFGIVDGVFHQSLAVSIQEIRRAIEDGARIYGCSSMGALRAAETYPLGMKGIGTIYQWYRDEIIDSDDEVAVAFDPSTFTPLSIPLVNLRATLKKLQCLALVDSTVAQGILQVALELPFSQRTYKNITLKFCEEFKNLEIDKMQELLIENEVNLKALDAKDLLCRIQSDYEKINSSGTE